MSKPLRMFKQAIAALTETVCKYYWGSCITPTHVPHDTK